VAIISSNVSSGPFSGNGSQTVFDFAFSVVSASDVRVEKNGISVSEGDYDVTIVSDIAGRIAFATPPAPGDEILILLAPDYLQTSEFADQGAYNLSTVNTINRRTAIKALATEDKARRALKVPLGEEGPEVALSDVPAIVAVGDSLLAGDAIPTVAGGIADIGAVAGSIANVNTVAGIHAAVSTVAGISAAVGAVSGIAANVSTVAGIAANVTTVAGVAGGIATLAPISANITTVAGISGNVTTVAANIAAVGTVATNIPAMATCATNIAAIIAAPTAAASVAADASTVAAALPLHNNTLVGNVQPAILRAGTTTVNADGTITMAAASNVFFDLADLPPAIIVARDAGLSITFNLEIVSGTLTTKQISQYPTRNAGGTLISTTVMTLASDRATLTITLDAGCNSLFCYAVSTAGAVVKMLGVTVGPPVRAVSDPTFLAAQGFAASVLNDAEPVIFTQALSVGTGAPTLTAAGVTTFVNGDAGILTLNMPRQFVDGDTGVVSLRLTLPAGRTISAATVYESSSVGNSSLHPVVEQIGADNYRIIFGVLAATAGKYFLGLALTIGNIPTGRTAVFDRFTVWRGAALPETFKVPAVVRSYADATAQSAIDYVPVKLQIDCAGDSLTYLNDQLNYPDFLQTLLTDRAVITNLGVPGDIGAEINARMASVRPVITLSGNQIPTSGPVSLTAWNVNPIKLLTTQNTAVDNVWYIGNIAGVIAASAFSGQNPTAITFTRLTAGLAVDVPAGSTMISRVGLISRKRKAIIWPCRNDPTNMVATAAAFATGRAVTDFIIVPYIMATNEAATNPYSATLSAAYPSSFFDPNYAPTTAELTWLNTKYSYTPDSTDTTQIAAGKIPAGLRRPADIWHLNPMGCDLIARRVAACTPMQVMLS
jgi:hypothetical protein